MKFIIRTTYLFVFALFLSCFCSCTKFADPAPVFEDDAENSTIEDRRILYINIDGAVGEEIGKILPTTINSILPKSKYTFKGVSEEMSNGGTTWTSLMTGVTESRHHVIDDEFSIYVEDDHAATPSYPSIFYRIMVTNPYYRTFAIVANELLISNVMREATDKFSFSSDEKVRDKAVEYLKTTNSKFGVVSFSSVKEAGLSSSFSADDPIYVDAVNKVDGYIGDILAAIEERENRGSEEWMIIIQSNNGGKESEQGGDSYAERNIFSIYYYPTFQSLEFQPEITTGARFYYNAYNTDRNAARVPTTNTSYLDMTGDEMTIEFSSIRNVTYGANSNAYVLGKSTGSSQNASPTNGWFFYQRNGAMAFYCHLGGARLITSGGVAFSNTDWIHHLVTIKKEGTSATISFYQNGSLGGTLTATVGASDRITASSNPFEIGGRYGHNTSAPQLMDMSFRNVRVWNKALTAEEVKEHACMNEVDPDLSYIDKLVADYPLVSDFHNAVAGQPALEPNASYNQDFKFPVYSWNTICTSSATNMIINNVDLAPAVFYWLKMENESWVLDGKNILEVFDQEFYNE